MSEAEDQAEDAAFSESAYFNRNPLGKNQYTACPSADNEGVKTWLIEYHRRGITNRKELSLLFREEHGIEISDTTIARRRKQLGLQGSGATTKHLSNTTKRQLVLDQMAKDPTSRQGPRMVKEGIAAATGINLTRDYITAEMKLQDPGGFIIREPGARKIQRRALVVLGPHQEWSADGHDKLSLIGFPIWAVREVWSGVWLGMWVIPNNRLKVVIAYLYLCLIENMGGMPVQTTTDCGSETGRIFGIANALREMFSPELCVDGGLPAHRFLKSVHNTTIERGWLQLRLKWGDNVKVIWEAGEGIYDSADSKQYDLVQWLWPKLIQQELDGLRDRFNNHRIRKDRGKYLPSGTTPNKALALAKQSGAENMLQPVDPTVIRQLKEELGGEELTRFVSVEYATHAQAVYDSLHIKELTLLNVWQVFQSMLPLM